MVKVAPCRPAARYPNRCKVSKVHLVRSKDKIVVADVLSCAGHLEIVELKQNNRISYNVRMSGTDHGKA
jgi:hypothetical protein